MSYANMIHENFATAITVARAAMVDIRNCGTYSFVFRACYLEQDTNKVPATGKAIFSGFKAAFDGGPKMPILKTPEDCNCFLGEHGNDVYRILHDYDHFSAYKIGRGTTRLIDEDRLNRIMVNRIMGTTCLSRSGFYAHIWIVLKACLLSDLVGQSYYYAQKKDFVGNDKQMAFVKWTAEAILPQVMAGKYVTFDDLIFPDFS